MTTSSHAELPYEPIDSREDWLGAKISSGDYKLRLCKCVSKQLESSGAPQRAIYSAAFIQGRVFAALTASQPLK